MVTILGIPHDENSSYLRGCALAPPEIRKAFKSDSSNTCAENERDLEVESMLIDAGDLALGTGAAARAQIEAAIDKLLGDGQRVLSLGGDHAVTYPILRAYGRRYENLSVLVLDAHPDLYNEFDGKRYSHACPFARAMEANLVGRLVQVGIRTMNGHCRKQADRFGVEIITMRDWESRTRRERILDLEGPVYLSLDLDVLDPAFAPGISHYEPGGMSTRQTLDIIQGLSVNLVGADVVEFNPTRDVNGATAMVAAKFMKEIAAKMLE